MVKSGFGFLIRFLDFKIERPISFHECRLIIFEYFPNIFSMDLRNIWSDAENRSSEKLSEKNKAGSHFQLVFESQEIIGEWGKLSVFRRKLTCIKGMNQHKGFIWRKAFQSSPASLVHEQLKITEFSLVDEGNEKFEAQSFKSDDCDFFFDFRSFKIGNIFFLFGLRKICSLVNRKSHGSDKKEREEPENYLFFRTVVGIKNDDPKDRKEDQKDRLNIKKI